MSESGGDSPVWAPDGKHLYHSSGDAVLRATLEMTPTPRLVTRDTVFRQIGAFEFPGQSGRQYDVTPDGSNVLVLRQASSGRRLVVSPHWIVEFRQRVAEAGKKR